MKTIFVALTSEQLPPIQPLVLDHWFFTDPVSGANFVYPASCYGGEWEDVIPISDNYTSYTAFVCGGYFFPWGYQVVDQHQNYTLRDLKGDTTIVFVPSSIDTTYHDVLKIVYDPDNGDRAVTINRPIISRPADFSDNSFVEIANIDSPTLSNQAFVYPASSQLITYHPTITALYSDMTRLFFRFTINIYPNSIYNIDNVHLVAAAQLSANNAVCTYEIESENTLAMNKVSIPSTTSVTVEPMVTFENIPLVTFNQEYIVPLSA